MPDIEKAKQFYFEGYCSEQDKSYTMVLFALKNPLSGRAIVANEGRLGKSVESETSLARIGLKAKGKY